MGMEKLSPIISPNPLEQKTKKCWLRKLSPNQIEIKMAKNLNNPSKRNKNLDTPKRGLGILINPEPETYQKEKASNKEFDTKDV